MSIIDSLSTELNVQRNKKLAVDINYYINMRKRLSIPFTSMNVVNWRLEKKLSWNKHISEN